MPGDPLRGVLYGSRMVPKRPARNAALGLTAVHQPFIVQSFSALRRGAHHVALDIVQEHRHVGPLDAQAVEGDREDRGVRFPDAHRRRVDDHIEELVRGHKAPPPLGHLADVVRDEGGAHPAGAQLADPVDHLVVHHDAVAEPS